MQTVFEGWSVSKLYNIEIITVSGEITLMDIYFYPTYLFLQCIKSALKKYFAKLDSF